MINLAGSSLLRFQKGHVMHKLLRPSLVSSVNSNQLMSGPESYELRHQILSEKNANFKWKTYRILSVGLLAGMAGCLVVPGNPLVDFATVTILVHHNHFGIRSVIADYAPLFFSNWFVNVIYMVWLAISVATLALLLSFNYNGAGFSRSVSGFLKL